MITVVYNGEEYEYLNTFVFDNVTYYSMINKNFKIIYVKVIQEKEETDLVFPSEEETEKINMVLVKKNTMVLATNSNIDNAINNNQNISKNYKKMIIEAVHLMIKAFPEAEEGLIRNLNMVSIREATDKETKDLKSINGIAAFDPKIGDNGTLLLPKNFESINHYMYILVHELFHVASYDKDKQNLGFLDLETLRGTALNEGMTEYLTRSTFKDYNHGFTGYNDDTANVCLFSSIVHIDTIIDQYFNGGLDRLYQSYRNKSRNYMTFPKIIANMDDEHLVRVRNSKLTGNFREQYLSTYLDDYNKIVGDNIWFTVKYKTVSALEGELGYMHDLIEHLTNGQPFKDQIDQKFRSIVVSSKKSYDEMVKQKGSISYTVTGAGAEVETEPKSI